MSEGNTLKAVPVTCLMVAMLLTSGCATPSKQLPGGGFRPTNPRFELAREPYRLPSDSLIDTGAAYLCTGKSIASHNTGEPVWSFLRFFPNGQAFMQYGEGSVPSSSEYDALDRGTIGYYRLDGNNLKCEFFVPTYGDCYHRYFGILQQDAVLILYWEYGRWPSSRQVVNRWYLKKTDLNLHATPDW